ncbi:hypothetical protein [Nitrosophilus kaiyonis]|uniref:hypothetical protein n=1 Tax=Nitrosophilus kaiyonis TaxID=2930200 RepID=UPI002491A333|nr:hypothetical protein [Nitrosophilus kaiyonis]
MSKKEFKKLFSKANRAFLNGDYKKAIFYYSLILKQDPENREAKIGILLSDLATEENDEANVLYDYYYSLKKEKNKDAEKIIEDIINSHDTTLDQISKFINEDNEEFEEGISYKDFKKHIEYRGSFKRAFEDIMFSTKVIIHEKKDFLDFLEELIDNGYEEMAMSYLEDASSLYPTDTKIREMFEKIKPRIDHHEN